MSGRAPDTIRSTSSPCRTPAGKGILETPRRISATGTGSGAGDDHRVAEPASAQHLGGGEDEPVRIPGRRHGRQHPPEEPSSRLVGDVQQQQPVRPQHAGDVGEELDGGEFRGNASLRVGVDDDQVRAAVGERPHTGRAVHGSDPDPVPSGQRQLAVGPAR